MDDFAAAIAQAHADMGGKGIGTMGEKTLHLALKYYFAPDPESHERPVGGFIADAVTEDGIVEVQTRSLSRLKPKLDAFLPCCPVTVVHPVILSKELRCVDACGELLMLRKSPKHESPLSVMREVYTLREYLADTRFRICLCGIHLAEYRLNTTRGQKLDREPVSLEMLWMLCGPADYAALLPADLPEELTAAGLAKAARIPEISARCYLNLLGRLGCAKEAGRRKDGKIWRMTAPN